MRALVVSAWVVGHCLIAGCGSPASSSTPRAELPSGSARPSSSSARLPSEVVSRVLVDGRCPAPRTCRFDVEGLTAILKARSAADVVHIAYGGSTGATTDKLRPKIETLFPQLAGQLDALGRDGAKVKVPLTVTFEDGTYAAGDLLISGMTLRVLFDDLVRGVLKGPIALPNDTSAPADRKPRAMWTIGGTTTNALRGDAPTPDRIDWILVVDDVSRDETCTRTGSKVSISDTRGRVYERRTGALVGERIFRSEVDPCGGSTMGMRDAEPVASWAWESLRNTPR